MPVSLEYSIMSMVLQSARPPLRVCDAQGKIRNAQPEKISGLAFLSGYFVNLKPTAMVGLPMCKNLSNQLQNLRITIPNGTLRALNMLKSYIFHYSTIKFLSQLSY